MNRCLVLLGFLREGVIEYILELVVYKGKKKWLCVNCIFFGLKIVFWVIINIYFKVVRV